jgi:ribosomal protein S18 acetylase RimI-like enzyme
MTEQITLTSADEADVSLLLSLVHAAFEEYRPLLNPPSGAHRETLETIGKKLAEGGAFIAWNGETALGCVLIEYKEDALYLGRLAVLPQYRRLGVARLLIDAVENQARESSLYIVTLSVRVQLPRNRAFFERLGYQFVAYHNHDGHTEPTFLTLEKHLAPTWIT